MARGKFITFEGGEGTGKSTQIALLAEALTQADLRVYTTREPGGSPGAEEIRKLLVTGAPDRWDPMTEALLHFAARRNHLQSIIHPRLEAGDWVLSDRFADSTLAYQGYGHGLGQDAIARLYGLAVGDFTPDLTLILDVPVELGLARATSGRRSEDRYLDMGRAFHENVRQGFLDIADNHPERCILLDGAVSSETLFLQICAALNERFGMKISPA